MKIDDRHINDNYDRRARRGGIIAVVLYVVMIALALGFTRCDTSPDIDEELTTGSILISFGDDNEGSGDIKQQQVEPVVASPPTPEPEPVVEEILTDESSETEIEESPEADQPEEVVAPVREVDKRALFPGTKSATGESRGESELPKKSVTGSSRGSTEAHSTLLGGGLSGDFDLAGRTLMGSLPVPQYSEQQEGRVVINIAVDETGAVSSASLNTSRSTTNNSQLINAAREAALKARFSPSESFVQTGTITYIFTLS